MTFEQRLRTAMQARVDGVDAPELRLRSERPRRVWPALVAGFAIAVVVAVVVGLLAAGNPGGVAPASPRHPARVVAATSDGRLVIVSAADGHILRTLADDAVAANGISVSPDGGTVFYARNTGTRCGTGDPITTIAAIRVGGGAATDLASSVRFPAVSPDGRSLAFTGIPNCSDAARSILVRDLTTDAHRSGSYDQRWDTSTASSWLAVMSLSWTPDSRRILFTHAASPSLADDGSPRLLDTRAPSPAYLDASPILRVAPDVICCTFGATGPEYGSVLDTGGVARDVVTVDPRTGEVARTLTCCGEVIDVDRSGRSLLIHFTDATSPGGIYRWSRGEKAPTYLGGLLFAAAWLPGS